MSDFTTDQAEREASGAHPYGRYLEEFEIGAVYKHWPAKTVTETEDHLFCLLTMNHHPLHVNDVYAAQSQQGRNVVVGPMVYSLALGMSVSDISGKAIANLQTEELKHPAPVFHGDTLFCETEVLEKRESQVRSSIAARSACTRASRTRTACSSRSSSASCSCRARTTGRRRPRATSSSRQRRGAPVRRPSHVRRAVGSAQQFAVRCTPRLAGGAGAVERVHGDGRVAGRRRSGRPRPGRRRCR